MYKACIYNDDKETIIHYPSANSKVSHVTKMETKEPESTVSNIIIDLDIDNPGYNLVAELKTKVKIIDLRDSSIRWTGRVLNIDDKMDSSGQFYKELTCEDAMSYLVDSYTRNMTFLTANPASCLSQLLDNHNSRVSEDKKIVLGTVNITGSIAYTSAYETTLSAILNAFKDIDCLIRVREYNNVLYLDCLKPNADNPIEVRLGKNLKEMSKSKDPTDLATRIIPLGANNLTIADANNGYDYIEDATAKAAYGIIEKTVSYSEITDAAELKEKAIADLSNYTQPKISFEIDALDLSFLTGVKSQEFVLNANLHIVVPPMGIDDIFKITEVDDDLLKAYNPKLTISNNPCTATDTITDFSSSAINNNSVHNGVQVGDDFGIRIVSGDGKFVITLNATEGISIEDVINNLKKFFIDLNGNLTMDGIQQITKNGKVVIENTVNDYGGINNIYDIDGNLVFKIGVESGSSDNAGATLIGYNKSKDKPRFKLGISKDGDFGSLQVLNKDGTVKAVVNGDDKNNNGVFFIVDSNNIRQRLATEEYVQTYVADHMPSTPTGGGTSGS